MKKEQHQSKKANLTQIMSIKRFIITYLILMGLFFLLIGFTPIQKVIDINGLYTQAVVSLTAMVLEIMGIPCTYQGSIIKVSGISLDVRFGCNGLEAVMIYAVAIIAFPATWKKRLIGIVGGFLVIQVINIIRIAALGYSGIYLKSLFKYIHIYVAQGIMIAVAIAMFLLWIEYAKNNTDQD